VGIAREPRSRLPLIRLYPAEEMEAYRVSPCVNKPDHEGPECIEPAGNIDNDRRHIPAVVAPPSLSAPSGILSLPPAGKRE